METIWEGETYCLVRHDPTATIGQIIDFTLSDLEPNSFDYLSFEILPVTSTSSFVRIHQKD